MRRVTTARWSAVCLLVVPAGGASAPPAAAQDGGGPDSGSVSLTAGVDVVNAYFFRGIPQDDTGVIMWPSGELGSSLFSGDGASRASVSA